MVNMKAPKPNCELMGESEYITHLKEEIGKVAKKVKNHDMLILILGPSGSGKELIAKEIYKQSGLKPWKAINCAAIPADLFESELFGHVKGAFTGAISDKPGLVKTAEGGVLFLDEIGDLTLPNQAKILRFLQEKSYYPVGSDDGKNIKEIRIIAATNKDLKIEVSEERFRNDLYYRLNSRIIKTKPLNGMMVDIISLLNYFIEEMKIDKVDPKAKFIMYSYSFPGNIRELKSLIINLDDYQYIKNYLLSNGDQNILKALNFINNDTEHDYNKIVGAYEILTLLSYKRLSKAKIAQILHIRNNYVYNNKAFRNQYDVNI